MRLFRLLLRCLPSDFRADYAGEIEQTFRAQRHDAQRERSSFRLWAETIVDVMSTAPREHFAILCQDVHYALRSLLRAPLFALASIATMAVGIGGVAVVTAAINGSSFDPCQSIGQTSLSRSRRATRTRRCRTAFHSSTCRTTARTEQS